MKIKKLNILIFLIVSIDVTAQELVSLKELIDHSLIHNKLLEAQRIEIKAKAAEVGPKSSLEDPMLTFEAQNYPVDSFRSNEYGMTGRQISLVQKIPFPGKRGLREKAAKSEVEREHHFEKEKELSLIKDIKILYFEIYLAHKKKSLLEKQQVLVDKTLGVVRSQYTTGKSTQADVLNLQVEYGRLTEKILAEDKQITSLSAEMVHHLGGNKDFQNKKPAPIEKSKVEVKSLAIDVLSSRAIKNNPLLLAMKSEFQIRSDEKLLAKKSYFPDFEIGAGYTFRDPTPGDRGVDFASIKIGINIPLWANSKQSEEVKVASLRESRSEVLLQNEKIHLERELKMALAAFVEFDQKLELFETSLAPLSRQAAESSRAAYLSGKLDFASFLKAISTQFDTELSKEEALVMREKYIATLEWLVGEEIL